MYRRDKIDKKENDTRYQNIQKQRAMERAIRETKREISLLNKIGLETIDERDILKEQQSTIKEFVEKNDLVRRPDRERIF